MISVMKIAFRGHHQEIHPRKYEDTSGDRSYKEFYKDLIDGTKVYLVDGDYVRTNLGVDFIGGGHGFVYKFIPKDEIWIEKVFDSNDHKFFLIHEVVERLLMQFGKWGYDKAHDFANSVEHLVRNAQ